MADAPIRLIHVWKEKCNGCRICELRCSFEHDIVFSPTLSRINVHKKEIEGIAIPNTCVICGKCIDSCPEGALGKSENTGAIKVNEELCTGCQECVKTCPFNVMKTHPTHNVAMTCDLCSGNPQCVRYCPEEALQYMTANEFSVHKKLKRK
jgi:Fe-S-cluster-containing hydrogenase component 2